MAVLYRFEFKSEPSPATSAAMIAAAVMDPAYANSDILRKEGEGLFFTDAPEATA